MIASESGGVVTTGLPGRPSLKFGAEDSLQARLTPFVGRRAEVQRLTTIVATNRLVTLTGAGGIGKTRLAIEVMSQLAGTFADGTHYIDLAPISDSSAVPETVAHALGIPDQAGRSAMEALSGYFAERRMLVVLDNCEHLLDASAAAIDALLKSGSRPTVLTTSRAPIGVSGELTWTVPSLSVNPDAIDLFVDRASRIRPDFSPGIADLTIIAEICGRLDGLPLAIELAAARVRALSVEDIRGHLQDRFELLTGGARTVLPRHQTLRASVDWSYETLAEAERSLFRRLGVFLGGFDLRAAGAVVDRAGVVDLVGHLVEKSLIVAEDDSGAMRYRLLETMRQYALAELAESADADAAREAHRNHYVDRAATFAATQNGGRQHLVDWAQVEFDNLRAAYMWSRDRGDVDAAVALASLLQPFWLDQGRLREGIAWFEAALPDRPTSNFVSEVWVRGVVHASTLGAWLEAPTSLDRALHSVSIARRCNDPVLTSSALNVCSILTRYDTDASETFLSEAIDLARAAADPATLCETLFTQTILSGGMDGSPRVARAAAEECLGIADALDDRFMSWSSQIWLGNALLMMGELDDADRILQPLVLQRASAGQLFMSFYASIFLGRVHAYRGRPESARTCWRAAQTTASAMGGFQEDVAYAMLAEAALAAGDEAAATTASETSWRRTATERTVFNRVLNPMAETLLASGQLVAARQWADDTVAITRGSNLVAALNARAHIACAQDEFERAARDCHDALDIAQLTGGLLRLPDVVECFAQVTSLDADQRTSARLYGAAAGIRAAKGLVRFALYQADYEAGVQSCRQVLGDRAFDAAWAEGSEMSVEEMIAYAQRGRGKRKRPRSGWESLTPTEIEVVRLVRKGLDNKVIAARLLISHRTVQTHLTHVYAKLGIGSRVGLVLEAEGHV